MKTKILKVKPSSLSLNLLTFEVVNSMNGDQASTHLKMQNEQLKHERDLLKSKIEDL